MIIFWGLYLMYCMECEITAVMFYSRTISYFKGKKEF